MGMEEYLNQKGTFSTSLKVRQIHSVATIQAGDFKIPDTKKLESYASSAQPVAAAPTSGMNSYGANVPLLSDEEIPF